MLWYCYGGGQNYKNMTAKKYLPYFFLYINQVVLAL